jgi:hypothetical protein
MTEAAALPSEIEQLPDLASYFKRASNPALLSHTLSDSARDGLSNSPPYRNLMPSGERCGGALTGMQAIHALQCRHRLPHHDLVVARISF